MCHLLKYSMLKPGLRLAAFEGDASKAGKRAFSGYGRAAEEEANKEGSRITALCGCGRGEVGSKSDREE